MKYSCSRSTPVLEGAEWRKLLITIPDTTMCNLRDRALIDTLAYSFARITAALKMKVEDLRSRGAGWTIRLHEKGGKQHRMPCHHALAKASASSRTAKAGCFVPHEGTTGSALSDNPMTQPDAWRKIRRRAAVAGVSEEINCHRFRATGITTSPTAARSSTRRRDRIREPAYDQAL
jgi:integrase